MAADAIKIRAQAAKLFKETGNELIEGYKTMPLEELRGHLGRIQGKPKGKPASANGATTRTKGKASAAAPVKGKPAVVKGKASASTSVPAKSTAHKSSSPRGKAATGTAKRPTAAAVKGKATATKGKTAPVKARSSAKSTITRKPATRKANLPARVDIDNKAVDWKAEWGGGKTGKRADVMSALRKFKGDKAKVFTLLAPNARKYYKGRTKDEAERLLVWLIGRVAFDFVTATGQHEKGNRAAYGQANDPKNVARRENRATARKEREKAERAAKRASSASKPAARKTATAKAPVRSRLKGKGK